MSQPRKAKKKNTVPAGNLYRLVTLVEEYLKSPPGEGLMKWKTPKKSLSNHHHAE